MPQNLFFDFPFPLDPSDLQNPFDKFFEGEEDEDLL